MGPVSVAGVFLRGRGATPVGNPSPFMSRAWDQATATLCHSTVYISISVVNKFDCCNKKKRRKEIISSPTNDTDGAENSGNEAYDVELGVVKKKKPAKAGKGNKCKCA